MASVLKDVLYPGTYRLKDGRIVSFTPDDIRHLAQRLGEMTAANVPVPVAWEHHDDAKPMTESQRKTAGVRDWHLGFAESAKVEPEGYLALNLDVPSEADAKRLPAVRFVSPEIIEDWTDGNGRKWPGKSITHVAVTTRPVQHNQKPFGAVQMSVVRLSLGDLDMADKPDDKDKGKKGDTPAGDVDIKKVLEALVTLGVNLPEDTTLDNLTDRLIGAAAAKGGTNPEPRPEPKPEPTPVTMSLAESRLQATEARLLKTERKGLESRVETLFTTGRVNKPIRDELQGKLKTVQLSLDDQGEVKPNDVLLKIQAYEALPKHHVVQLGRDRPEEVPPPHHLRGQPESEKEVNDVAKDWDAALGRK